MTLKRRRPPFAMVPESLLHAGVSDRAVRLYAVLDRYADKEDKAWPSRETIAGNAWLRCSTDSVDRAVKELERAGYLAVERRVGERASNIYHLLDRPRKAVDKSAGSRTGAAMSSRTETEPVAARVRNERERENENNCERCEAGWILDSDGKAIEKCTHERKAAS